MLEKHHNIIVTVMFMLIIFGFSIASLIMPDKELSSTERRRLEQMPQANMENLLNGEFFSDFESYYLDQFVLRNEFRTVQSVSRIVGLGLKDCDGVYVHDGVIYQMDYPINEKSPVFAAEKFAALYEKYFNGNMAYYSIIPDKNCFGAPAARRLSLDFEKMTAIYTKALPEHFEYIDISSCLQVNDYYKTDLHWRQECILDVADELLLKMKNTYLASSQKYEKVKLSPFYGSYYGTAALPLEADSLIYMTNKIIQDASVYIYETGERTTVYRDDLFDSIDPYNVFLSGPVALATVSNPRNPFAGELYIVRDSFSSSLIPLLIEGYSKITMIDLRYISANYLSNFIEPRDDVDVLFLHGTRILNQSSMLK